MTEAERKREKELKQLIYIRNELIKEAKRELKIYREELYQLGADKNKGNKVKKRRKK